MTNGPNWLDTARGRSGHAVEVRTTTVGQLGRDGLAWPADMDGWVAITDPAVGPPEDRDFVEDEVPAVGLDPEVALVDKPTVLRPSRHRRRSRRQRWWRK